MKKEKDFLEKYVLLKFGYTVNIIGHKGYIQRTEMLALGWFFTHKNLSARSSVRDLCEKHITTHTLWTDYRQFYRAVALKFKEMVNIKGHKEYIQRIQTVGDIIAMSSQPSAVGCLPHKNLTAKNWDLWFCEWLKFHIFEDSKPIHSCNICL